MKKLPEPHTKEFDALSLKEKILSKVVAHDWVTFVELQRLLGDEAEGDFVYGADDMNILYWCGLSRRFVDAIESLNEERLIDLVPAVSGTLAYFIDGGRLRLPVAKRPPANGYKKPHWLPVCLRPGSVVTGKKRPSIGRPNG